MSNAIYMDAHFERNKNVTAAAITLIVCGGLLFLFITMQWIIPQVQPPVADEGFEVNLGTSETGFGNEQPLISGEPAPSQTVTAHASQSASSAEEKEQPTNDNEASPVATSPVVKPVKKPEKENPTTVKKTVTMPTPPTPKPKAQMKTLTGGNGTGGNNSEDHFTNNLNEGNDKGTTGDKGKLNGDPNAKGYDGNSPSGHGGGLSFSNNLLKRGTRSIPNFSTDKNWDGWVYLILSVDENGKVINVQKDYSKATALPKEAVDFVITKVSSIIFKGGINEEGKLSVRIKPN